MTTFFPPKVNTQLIWYSALYSQADPTQFQTNPTIAAGDATFSLDGGTVANFGTLPAVTPASSNRVKYTGATTELNGANAHAVMADAAGAEWIARDWNFVTAARQIEDLAFPATSGRSMVVDAAGLVDANTVKLGPTGAGTAQTARDIGLSVLISAGTGTGQLSVTSGIIGASLSAAERLAILDIATSLLTTAGSAGKLIVDNLTGLKAVADAIKALTDNLPADTEVRIDSLDSQLATIDNFVDTEITALPNATRDAVFSRAFSAAYNGLTFDEFMKAILVLVLCKTAGADTGSIDFRKPDDSGVGVNTTNDGTDRTGFTLTL